MQGPDEGAQRTHLPWAAEVEMSEVRQNHDAAAKREIRFLIRAEPLNAQDSFYLRQNEIHVDLVTGLLLVDRCDESHRASFRSGWSRPGF